jgi:hypothetical protein
VARHVTGRLEARFRSLEKTEAHAAAHVDRFAVHLSDITLHDAEVLGARPRLPTAEHAFRRERLAEVRVVPRDASETAWIADLEDIEATEVEYHDVIGQDARRFGRLTAHVVATLWEPAPEPPPPPPPPPLPPPAPPRPIESPRSVEAPSVALPEIGTRVPSGGLGGIDPGTRFPRGTGWQTRSCSTSGCGVLAWPFLMIGLALLVLAALHATAFAYHLVGRLWLLLRLPTVSGSGMPGWGSWLVENVNWGGVLVLGVLGLWWMRRRVGASNRHSGGG